MLSVNSLISNVVISSLLIMSVSACGGRDANPVSIQQYGDEKLSCDRLEYQISTAQNEINRLLPKKNKTASNTALGVAGWFLIVPWFFMDFKNAEAQEYEAYRQRYNHLVGIAIDKQCGSVSKDDLNSYPSVEELKRQYEEQKAKETRPTE